MRVVIVGAIGNIGTSLLDALAEENAVDSILGLARRPPERSLPKTTWAAVGLRGGDLETLLRGADDAEEPSPADKEVAGARSAAYVVVPVWLVVPLPGVRLRWASFAFDLIRALGRINP